MIRSGFLIIVFCFFVSTVDVLGTDPKLVLNGSVVNISVGCAHNKPYAAVGLLMQFYNNGNEAVIILSPYYDFHTRVLFAKNSSDQLNERSITGDVLSFNPYLDDPHGVVTRDDYDHLPGLIRSLKLMAEEDQPRPSSPWRLIEPGGYYEFRSGLMIKNGFKFVKDSTTKSEKCDAKNYEAFPENDSLKVEYFFSLKKFKEGEELFTALRDAWKPHGNLLLNSHGNISYRSGLIKFHNDEQVR